MTTTWNRAGALTSSSEETRKQVRRDQINAARERRRQEKRGEFAPDKVRIPAVTASKRAITLPYVAFIDPKNFHEWELARAAQASARGARPSS